MNKENSQRSHLSKIKPSNIIYPIIIGLGVVGYMLYKEFNIDMFKSIEFTWDSLLWITIAIVFMVGRDLGYMIRLRVLSDKKISWYETFRVIMLWEFTSAVTPSAIGGTSFAIIYVHKAGLTIGKSSAIVLLTSFFDELYFIIMFPLLFFLVGKDALFNIAGEGVITDSIISIALIGYFLKLTYTLFVSYGLFINPNGLKWIVVNVFRLPILRKWRTAAAKTGDDIILSSTEIKRKDFVFWLKAIGSTFMSWSSRYLVVNAIILAFFSFGDHLLLFARQLVMWIMMLIMPTPGGSGFSEYFFKEYLGEFIPVDPAIQIGVAMLMALLWRMITYYPYLVIGAIMFPRWFRDKFGKTTQPTRKQK